MERFHYMHKIIILVAFALSGGMEGARLYTRNKDYYDTFMGQSLNLLFFILSILLMAALIGIF